MFFETSIRYSVVERISSMGETFFSRRVHSSQGNFGSKRIFVMRPYGIYERRVTP